jgi:HD-like signal output (HDOD) protein/CheY-like chemotaxis protein
VTDPGIVMIVSEQRGPPAPVTQPRILFVDDEPQILRSLGRILRGRRSSWDMEFVGSGAAALESLSRRAADVIVTDVTMPEIDGLTLLTRVRQDHPGTVRVVLSGTLEGAVGMRAIPVAHQFLGKPWDPADLIEVIERALALRAFLDSSVLRAIVGRMSSLPAIPAVYQRLSRAVHDPSTRPEQVAEIVASDPAIAARVLQLAASPFFNADGPIESVADAVARLGISTLRNLVLASEVFNLFEEKSAPERFSLPTFQRHALATGRIAAAIAPRRVGEALAAGLLHDVGELILAAELPEQWVTINALAAADGRPVEAVELEQLGTTHAEIGAYLLGLWGLPREIVEAVAFHDRPRRAGGRELTTTTVVHLADRLARELDGTPGELDHDWLAELGVAGELPGWRAVAAQLAKAPAINRRR